MATILLEAKSDIEGQSAMDMALGNKLQKFVSRNRIERITTSVMNDYEFLNPENISEAFEIDPLSIGLVFRKLFYPQFCMLYSVIICTIPIWILEQILRRWEHG